MKSVKTTKAIDAGSQAPSITLMMLPAKCEINTEEERTEPVCGERRPFEPEACDLTEGE
jgi:hypothetical protein